MLLTRLVEHAQHRELPPPYYRRRAVRWAIQIDQDGRPVTGGLSDRSDAGSPKGGFLAVPYVYRAGPKTPAVLLVDTLQYVLGTPKDETAKEQAETQRRHDDYLTLLRRWRDAAPGDPTARAVLAFFEQGAHRTLSVPEDAKPSDLAALLVSDAWAHEAESATALWAEVVRERKSSDGSDGICLVCGQTGALLDTIPQAVTAGAIPVPTGRGRDAQIVSINKPAQGRAGIIQLASTPICDHCGSTAMAVLNALLADPDHRHRCNDSVLVWWMREVTDFDPLRVLREAQPGEVATLLKKLQEPRHHRGALDLDDNAFHAVTLSANESRVVLRDWIDVPLNELKARIGAWFDDHRVVDLWQDDPQVVRLWRLARATGRWADAGGRAGYVPDTVPDSCERDLLLTALWGTAPPAYLLPHLIQRVRADHRVDLPRAALVRLILTRYARSSKETSMPGLNPDAGDAAYQCGRLFAALEAIQRVALPNVNATITDKYFSVAMASPLMVITTLRKNADGHLKRLARDKPGAQVNLKRRMDDIAHRLDDVPATLDLHGQARFMLGYHHQRAADLAAYRQHQRTNPSDSQPPQTVEETS